MEGRETLERGSQPGRGLQRLEMMKAMTAANSKGTVAVGE
jgi:hypothetical protein